MLGTVWQDLRHAARSLGRAPGFTAAAIATLAIGVGISSAMFTVIDATLLHPLPYPAADRLVAIYGTTDLIQTDSLSYPNFLDLRRSVRSFAGMAAWREHSFVLTGQGLPEALTGQMVSANYFAVLGVVPTIGRTFALEEDMPGGSPAVMLGERFWRRRFHADPDVIGRHVTLAGRVHTIIGVVPSTVRLLRAHATSRSTDAFDDVFTPIGQYDDPLFYQRSVNDATQGVARLRDGVTLQQAQSELTAVASALAQQYPDSNRGVGVRAIDLREDLVGGLRPALVALIGAVALVLVIASANAANLLLSRSLSRMRELAVRAALGASRGRLVRHALADGLVLAVAGGTLGVALAFWATRVVIPLLPAALPRGTDLQINLAVVAFAVFASVTAALLAAAVPAIAAVRSSADAGLRESGRGLKSGGHPAQQTFVIAQIALTMVLLVGAGVLGRTLINLLHVDPGFQAGHVTAFYTGVASVQGKTPEQIRQRFRAIEARVAAVPGVESASVEFGALPLTGNTQFSVLPADVAAPRERAADGYSALFYAAGPAYFQTMRIPVRRGRAFAPDDDSRHPSVAIIDEELARQLFPGQDAVGKRLRLLAGEQPLMEVVGVVGHVKHWGLDADRTAAVRGQLYIPHMQLPDPFTSYAARVTTVVVRSNESSAQTVSAIRRELAAYDADQAVHHERRMADVVLQSLDNRRFVLLLLGIFGVVALLLAIVGLYGVMSYAVTQRTPEFGVRMALGARAAQVLRHIVRQGQVVALKGIIVGTIGAIAASRMLSALLYAVSPADPLTFVVVGVIVCAIASVACVLPARRAARVDPAIALRAE